MEDSTEKPADEQTTDQRFAMVPLATLPKLAALSKAAVLVYVVLRAHANRQGRCFPSTATICKHTSLHEKTIGKAFAELETAGLLRREKRNGMTNLFYLLDEMTAELPTPEGPPIGGVPNSEGPPFRGGSLRRLAEGGSAVSRTITDQLTNQSTNQSDVKHASADAAQQPPVRSALESADKPRKRSPAYDPLAVAIPPSLDTTLFRQAWAAWAAHRCEIKPRLTEQTVKQQLRMLHEIGHDRAVETIRISIRQSWRGLFPENTKTSAYDRPTAPPTIIPGMDKHLPSQQRPQPQPSGEQPVEGKPAGESKPDEQRDRRHPLNGEHYDPQAQRLPTVLDTQAFRRAWNAWAECKQRRGEPLDQLTANSTLRMLMLHGEKIAIDTIDLSIANGWKGLFPQNVKPRSGYINTNPVPLIPTD